MNEPVAAVDANGQIPEKPRPDDVGESAMAGSRGDRFAHPSGSRPLEGYTIKRGVGHGGFGEVYYATSDAGKDVALKLVRRHLEVELRGVRQCLNLKHPNLLSVFDIREDRHGDKWVIMEYVQGQSLEQAVAAHPVGMPLDQVLSWIHGIGAGVACLHDHGIVHRDLKPGNIFCDEGIVKIGDYGLSKFISCSRRSGQTESVGTVHYMAPEVANGRYGKEIDVYALGVVLYEMLSGRVPFEGESVGEVLMKHLTASPDVSMLAEPYRSVVARALQKDPAQRFASVKDMMAALPRPAASGVGTGSFPSGGPSAGPGAGAAAGARAGAAGVNPFAETLPVVETVDEEPIFRAVRQFCRRMLDAWNQSNMNTPTKVVLMVVMLIAFAAMAETLLPMAVMLLMLYGCYWVIRTIVLSLNPSRPGARPVAARPVPPGSPFAQPSHPPPPQPPPLPPRQAHRFVDHRAQRTPHRAYRERPAEVFVLKPRRERLADLLGSMLGGAAVAVTTCVVMAILISLGTDQPLELENYGQIAWVILTSILATWAVLIPSKFWEGSRGDPRLRRFILLVVGLGLGVLAAGGLAMLTVDLPHDRDFPPLMIGEITDLDPTALQDDEALLGQMKYYLAAFGLLLLLVRWWRQADPLRKSRLSLWAMFVSGLVAALIADGCGFPQPWLVMVACAVSASVQLASPWIHPRRRAAHPHEA